MEFSEKLKKVMHELGLRQSQVVGMTGISKSSISQYLSGKNVPSLDKQHNIATLLGLEPDYFEQEEGQKIKPASRTKHIIGEFVRIKPAEIAKIVHSNHETIERGLKDRRFDWGYAVPPEKEGGRWTYIINAKKFAEIERLEYRD